MKESLGTNRCELGDDAHEELRQLIDTTPALIHTGRADGYLDYFNRGWLTYIRATLDDICGWRWRTSFILTMLTSLSASGVVIASGEPFVAESRVRRADGEYRWFFHQKVPVKDDHGNVIKWQGAGLETEERKRSEEAAPQSEHYLAEAERPSKSGSYL